MSEATIRSASYRGRRIEGEVTNASVDAFSSNARGAARVVSDDGTPVTPSAETWLMSTHSNDFTPLERHAGWILIGDFVLYNDGTTVHLWVGPEDRRALCRASTHFQWDHSDGIVGIRLWTTDEMLASTVSWEAEREQAEAVGPAARVFVDGCGWRWLFPHADGPAAALAHLRATSALDDLQQLSRLLPAAPPHERKLAERHFRCLVHGAASDASDRALDLTRIYDRSRVDAVLLERLEAVFAKPAVEALDLTVTGWRRASQGSDEWTHVPVSLADALAGRHEGRPGVRVVVRNRAATTLAGLDAIPDLEGVEALDLQLLTDISVLARLPRLKELTLTVNTHYARIDDFSALSGLVGLERLDLSGQRIADLSVLAPLVGLRALDVSGCTNVRDLAPLSGLSALESLDLRGTSASSLAPLAGLGALRTLDPSSGALASLDGAPSGWLTSLKSLSLWNVSALTDLGALRGASGLSELHLDCSSASDNVSALPGAALSVLLELPALRKLTIHGAARVTTLEHLAGLGVEELDFGAWREALHTLAGISTMKRLRQLSLRVEPGVDLRPIGELRELVSLALDGEVETLEGLQGCTGLKKLRIQSAGRVRDISPVGGLVALEELSLWNCKALAEITALEGLRNLRQLDLSGTLRINDLEPLRALRTLTQLSIGDAESVTSLAPLAGLTSLTSLRFGRMASLRSLDGLPAPWLEGERMLTLDVPALEDLGVLSTARSLTQLTLSAYGGTSLAPLGGLPALTEVSVADAPRLVDLAGLLPGEKLTSVTLRGTPGIKTLEHVALLPSLQGLTTRAWRDEHRLADGLAGTEALAARLGAAWTR